MHKSTKDFYTMLEALDVMYFERDGSPITSDKPQQWTERKHNLSYSIVSRDTFDDGTFLSTVWLGIPHGVIQGKPVIFETMSFVDEEWVDCVRYTTQDEAAEGHEEWLQRLLKERSEAGKTNNIIERWRPVKGQFRSEQEKVQQVIFKRTIKLET